MKSDEGVYGRFPSIASSDTEDLGDEKGERLMR